MLTTPVFANAKSKYYDWKKIEEDNLWRRVPKNSIYDQQELYIMGDSLYSPHYYKGGKWGEALITSWKIDESLESLQIVTAKQNKAYVELTSDTGKAILYSVNLKTSKKKIVSKNFVLRESTPPFFYAATVNTTDASSTPIYVWKFNGNSFKRGNCLGKYIIPTKVLGKYVYYGKYNNSSQKKVTICRADLDGSHEKKLFVVTGKGDYCQTLISDVTKNQIAVSTSINGKFVRDI